VEQITTTIIKYSSVPPLMVGVYAALLYRKLPGELKAFSWFIFLSAITEVASKILWFYSVNNLPLLHLYVAGGFFCLALFYQKVLKGFIDKTLIWIITGVFLVLTTINSAFIQPPSEFNSYALTVESILIVIFSLSTYMIMLNDIVRKNRIAVVKSLNWINSGLFIYYASSMLIFYYGDYFIRTFPRSFNMQTWVLHSFFAMVMYVCFFIGLWNRPRN
jgi:hypothetical protein